MLVFVAFSYTYRLPAVLLLSVSLESFFLLLPTCFIRCFIKRAVGVVHTKITAQLLVSTIASADPQKPVHCFTVVFA